MHEQLEQLAALEAGWDGEGAPPLSRRALGKADEIMCEWFNASVAPLSCGGVQVETTHMEIEIGVDGKPRCMLFSFGEQSEWATLVRKA